MEKLRAVIWDVDGTLLDSYGVIVSSLHSAYSELGVELDREEIRRGVIAASVNDHIRLMEGLMGIPAGDIRAIYDREAERQKADIPPMPHAAEILRLIAERGVKSFIFTHRGASTGFVLKNTGLYGFFEEIITAKSGFARKPDPAAIEYLIAKYGLTRAQTAYVGDRAIDMECAKNARVQGVLYLPQGSPAAPTGSESHIVHDLMEIGELI